MRQGDAAFGDKGTLLLSGLVIYSNNKRQKLRPCVSTVIIKDKSYVPVSQRQKLRPCVSKTKATSLCLDRKTGIEEGRKAGIEEGIAVLIGSYTEDGAPESVIEEKLVRRYGITPEEAKEKIAAYGKQMKE